MLKSDSQEKIEELVNKSNLKRREKNRVLKYVEKTIGNMSNEPEEESGEMVETRNFAGTPDISSWESNDDNSPESNNCRKATRKEMRLDNFSGDIAKSRNWIADYKYCAIINRWPDREMAIRLPEFLTGSARN